MTTASDDNVVPDPTHCPSCGSKEIARVQRVAFFLLGAALLVGLDISRGAGLSAAVFLAIAAASILALLVPRWKCVDCGYLWNGGENPTDNGDEEEDQDFVGEERRCAACESEEIERIKRLPIVLFIAFLFVSLTLLGGAQSLPSLVLLFVIALGVVFFALPVWRCKRCEHSWR